MKKLTLLITSNRFNIIRNMRRLPKWWPFLCVVVNFLGRFVPFCEIGGYLDYIIYGAIAPKVP
ncbi:hypothetical protein CPS_3493 [Colwellia psychrerythraea 34H]|uniref:Uncharacterized protein n=1 Tax=Colwellia psychrerythraea (strain 34H / ATCC BAA-681) TaxID=167879 RepID=Q47YF3_COLP3|nr:hypothetical protein CPS_3493 [Colwellia psychrerythraea 34H]